jgi:hypothetical protein
MKFRWSTFIAFVLSVAAPSYSLSQSSAWIFLADKRKPSHSAMVGTLRTNLPHGEGVGTAVLIDECGILTNFHVAFGPWYVTQLSAPSHEPIGAFTLTEITRADGSHPTARATPVRWGDYAKLDQQLRGEDQDWAYLVLDPCLGLNFGYYHLRSLDPDDADIFGETYSAIGYSSGRQLVDPNCALHPVELAYKRGGVFHDCTVLVGDSGGPIVRNGSLSVIAIASGFRVDMTQPSCSNASQPTSALARWESNCTNLAVPVTIDMIEKIRIARLAVWLQLALKEMGYDTGRFGAIEDEQFKMAVVDSQRHLGLPTDGKLTYALCAMLSMLSGKSYPPVKCTQRQPRSPC